MPKGYWIARVDVKDPERYKDYVTGAAPVFQRFGARFLARGSAHEAMEGTARARNVVIEFPSVEAAKDCYHSPEYQAAAAIRQSASESELVIVEGIDG